MKQPNTVVQLNAKVVQPKKLKGNEMQVIFRAKYINSDDYIEGFLVDDVIVPISFKYFKNAVKIDTNTLSINFKDMLDKNNKPIFASLSEDNNGGDIVNIAGTGEVVVNYGDQYIYYGDFDLMDIIEDVDSLEAVGIYEVSK